MTPAHATLVAAWREGRWRAVLLRGPSGAGKSTLALQLITRHGFRLVADDRVVLWASGGRAWGAAPATLKGLIEVRGVGVLAAPALERAAVALAADLSPVAADRVPDPRTVEVAGVAAPHLTLDAAGPAAAERILAALHLARP